MQGDFLTEKIFLIPVRRKDRYEYQLVADPKWNELAKLLQRSNTTQLFTFLPPEFQLETLILHTLRELKIPATFGTVFDLAWNVSALSVVSHDTIVSTPKVFPFLEKALDAHMRERVKTIVFVGAGDALESDTTFDAHTLSHPHNSYERE